MLKNYFKIAIAVLKRRKFFTFISLFGISFTLTMLIVLASFIDNVLSTGYPDTDRPRELFIYRMRLASTTNGSNINGGPSFYFFDHYVSKLKTQEKLAIASNTNHTNSYTDKRKLTLRLMYTNDQYWDVLHFSFIEGKPYTKQQLENGEKVAVITEDTRDNYFGKGVSATGKFIETDNIQYRVSGVVKNPPLFNQFANAEMYLPYSLSKSNLHYPDISGNYNGILLLHSKDDIPKMKEEYNGMVSKVEIPDKTFNVVTTSADTYLEYFGRNIIDSHSGNDGLIKFFLLTGVFLFLFLLLPTLNLVNINISRIMDRSSEIGVRKAFGASSQTLVYQFIIENLILTFFGGALGLLFSFIVIQIINSTGLLTGVQLVISFNVFFFSLLTCIFFGLLSGVYPAWRMSRLNVVAALKV